MTRLATLVAWPVVEGHCRLCALRGKVICGSAVDAPLGVVASFATLASAFATAFAAHALVHRSHEILHLVRESRCSRLGLALLGLCHVNSVDLALELPPVVEHVVGLVLDVVTELLVGGIRVSAPPLEVLSDLARQHVQQVALLLQVIRRGAVHRDVVPDERVEVDDAGLNVFELADVGHFLQTLPKLGLVILSSLVDGGNHSPPAVEAVEPLGHHEGAMRLSLEAEVQEAPDQAIDPLQHIVGDVRFPPSR